MCSLLLKDYSFNFYSLLKDAKLLKLSLAPYCKICRVTEEASVAETAGWPVPLLINMFTALKGSQFYSFVFVLFKSAVRFHSFS